MDVKTYNEMHRKLKIARSPAQRAGVMNVYSTYRFTGAEAMPRMTSADGDRGRSARLSVMKPLPVRAHGIEYYADLAGCTVRAKAWPGKGTQRWKEHFWVETAPYEVVDPGCGEADMTPEQYTAALYAQRAERRAWCKERAAALNERKGA